MTIRTLDGLVFEPADVGINNAAIGAGLTTTGLVIPWRRAFRIHNIAWRMTWTDVGAMTADLFCARFSDAGVQSTPNVTLHQAITNAFLFGGLSMNYGMISRYTLQEGSVGSGVITKTGAATIAPGLAFECPYIRFAFRNNAAVPLANVSVEVTIFE